jgi:hypothetical protein
VVVVQEFCKSNIKKLGNKDAYIGLSPNFPAKIIPIKLNGSNKFIGKSGAYMSAIGEVSVEAGYDCCSLLLLWYRYNKTKSCW